MDKFCQKEHYRTTSLDCKSWQLKVYTQKFKCKKIKINLIFVLLFTQKCYTYTKNVPEIFDYRAWDADLKQAYEVFELLHIPGMCSEGDEIIYHRQHNSDPSYFNLEDFWKLLFMTVDLSLTKRGLRPGNIVLFDMEVIGMGHLARNNLSTIRKLFQYVQEAVPLRVQATHVLKTEPILEKMLSLIKLIMDSELRETIKFYKKNEVLKKIYDIVPKSALPSDYK